LKLPEKRKRKPTPGGSRGRGRKGTSGKKKHRKQSPLKKKGGPTKLLALNAKDKKRLIFL